MKSSISSLGIYFVAVLLLACNPQQSGTNENDVQSTTQVASMEKPLLRHVVLLKFKEESSPKDVRKVEEAFIALKDKISLIKDFEWGTNNSPEGLNKGLTHCFFVSFETEKDRDDYLPHPAHKEFVEILLPHLDEVTVVDYWAK